MPEDSSIVEFGRFRISSHRRELIVDGQPIRLGGRAFDVLATLVEARGTIVAKDALIRSVWPSQVIEDNTLQAQISLLRSALGADRGLVRTVAGRGYQFTGEIRILSTSPDEHARAGLAAADPRSSLPPTNAPEPVSELIGRDDDLGEVAGLASAHRLVTLTGPGGIGKTRLALAVSRRLLAEFADGVWLAEFSPLADPGLVPATVAAAVGLDLGGGEVSAQRVAQALADRRLLLVLDTCEHVIAAAAALAEAVLRACSAVRIIATSRERLRAEGEWVYPVAPLAVPAAEGDDPWQYGAIWLFVERARAAEPHFAPDRSLATIVAICWRLDGIPLAIELAAARAPALGIEELSGRLDDRFRLLTGGRRTALPRHQTLRATFDWSYELLTEPERVVLRRLAIFAGSFSLEAAGAVTASPEAALSDVIDGVANLVAKSLVVAEGERAVARYRLLDTTRAYALEKLADSGELQAIARRQAEYFRDLFEQAEAEWETRPTAEWLADYARQIDNLRAALDWAFSPSGDASIGAALTTAAVPLWMHLSLMDECRSRVEEVFAAPGAEPSRDALRAMKLRAALGASLIYTRGQAPETLEAWSRALAAAEKLDDTELRLQALFGLWNCHATRGHLAAAMDFACQFHRLAVERSEATDVLMGDRMLGSTLHFRGEQAAARHHLETMLRGYVPPVHRTATMRHQFDQRIVARALLARVCWMEGFPDQARALCATTLEHALATDHDNAVCYSLVEGACPVALFTGDFALARRLVSQLLDRSAHHGLTTWQVLGLSLEGELLVRCGDTAIGLLRLSTALEKVNQHQLLLRLPALLGALAEGCALAGQISEASAAIEQALAAAERSGIRWCFPDLLRIKGELLLLQAADRVVAAEDHFWQALDWAQRQGALSWELRAAISLARLLGAQGRSADATALLHPVYDRFTEGFDTADLKAAKALLDAFAEPDGLRARFS